MFYTRHRAYESVALVVLTPSESKRLIARAIKEMAEVKRALKEATIVIIGGTTNAFVLEELTGTTVDKIRFAAGLVARGRLDVNSREERIPPVVLKRGVVVELSPAEALEEFTAKDVYIKGANAIDAQGNAGVLMADPRGGTIGAAIGTVKARGAHLIMPVGLEKLVPSVQDASAVCGIGRVALATGEPVGFMPVMGAKVLTELDAIGLLFGSRGVEATHVASGGVGGCEGAVTIALKGKKEGVEEAFNYISALKGEAALKKD